MKLYIDMPGPKSDIYAEGGLFSLGSDLPQYAITCFDGCHWTVGDGPGAGIR